MDTSRASKMGLGMVAVVVFKGNDFVVKRESLQLAAARHISLVGLSMPNPRKATGQ